MFQKEYGDVTVKLEYDVPKRGTCLSAELEDNHKIYMDICGPMLAEGSNAYMYGNKLIVVTRWNDMSEEEIAAVNHDTLRFVFAPFRFVQMAMAVGSYGWSDVFFTLYHCGVFANDEKQPVDRLILLFADKQSGEIVGDRCITLPEGAALFLQQAMANSHKYAFLDFSRGEFKAAARADARRDYCDIVYDYLWEFSKGDSRQFRAFPDTDKVPLGIYVTVNGENEVTELYQYDPKE